MSMISDSLSPDIAELVQTAHSDSDSDTDDYTVTDTFSETKMVSNLAVLHVIQNYIIYLNTIHKLHS